MQTIHFYRSVRAGDGLHYKRSSSSANIFLTNFRDKDQPLLQPQQLSPFILHSPAPSNPDLDSPVGNVPEFWNHTTTNQQHEL